MGWVAHFNSSDWAANVGSWSTDHWVTGSSGGNIYLELVAIGAWAAGYRPTKIKITYDEAAIMKVQLKAGATWFVLASAYSGGELDIDWDSGEVDLASLYLTVPASVPFIAFNTLNIEFYESEGWTHKFMGVANAAISTIIGAAKANVAKVSGA